MNIEKAKKHGLYRDFDVSASTQIIELKLYTRKRFKKKMSFGSKPTNYYL